MIPWTHIALWSIIVFIVVNVLAIAICLAMFRQKITKSETKEKP